MKCFEDKCISSPKVKYFRTRVKYFGTSDINAELTVEHTASKNESKHFMFL